MGRTDEQNASLARWAERLSETTIELAQLATALAGDVQRLDNELAEIRDGMLALSNRIESAFRVIDARTQHLV